MKRDKLAYEVILESITNLTGRDLSELKIKSELEFIHFMSSPKEYTEDKEILEKIGDVNIIINNILNIINKK